MASPDYIKIVKTYIMSAEDMPPPMQGQGLQYDDEAINTGRALASDRAMCPSSKKVG